MTMTAVLIICFAIAMMLGPIMFMRPSAAQTRIAKLRSEAQKQGMRIRLAKNPFANNKEGLLAVYSLSFEKDREAVATFSLFRKNYAHGIHFCGQWEWHTRAELQEYQQGALREYLSGLDTAVQGVECSSAGVGLFWRERMQNVNDDQALQKILMQLQTFKTLCQT